jgi:hypothetical protein
MKTIVPFLIAIILAIIVMVYSIISKNVEPSEAELSKRDLEIVKTVLKNNSQEARSSKE